MITVFLVEIFFFELLVAKKLNPLGLYSLLLAAGKFIGVGLFRFFLLIVVLFSSPTYAEKIRVLNVSPSPNYIYKNIVSDINNITDGEVERFPIWTGKGAIGWVDKTPVTIEISIDDLKSYVSGVLKLHSAKGMYANVDIPRQVDVYTKVGHKYYLLASKYFESNVFHDKSSHWLEIELKNVTKELVVVLHSSTRFMFVDEVMFTAKKSSGVTSFYEKNAVKKKDLSKDSSLRLKNYIIKNSPAKKTNKKLIINSGIYTWLQNPWEKLDGSVLENTAQIIDVAGFNNEKEIFSIGVHNAGKKTAEVSLRFNDNSIVNALDVNLLLPVMAANGYSVYDVIKPIKNKLLLESGETRYLWLSLDFSKIALGNGSYIIDLINTRNKKINRYTLNTTNIELPSNKKVKLNAVNWAYTNDKPIWNNKKQTIMGLVDYGINVFVVHPHNIPGLKLKGFFEKNKIKALQQDLSLYKGKGKILLYMGWSSGKNPLNIDVEDGVTKSVKVQAFKVWVSEIRTLMLKNGISYNDWALYPVDEPRGDEFVFLKKVAQHIKQVDSNIQIYTDPTSSVTEPTAANDMADLDGLIDIWQPHLKLVKENHIREFFHKLSAVWWIYHNPAAPAKTSSPLNDYRKTAWWAWKLGAKGVGFWSYSDTGGSSAWDDFDGYRPDWAVVYESNKKLLSSRRWEAFRDGVEDYYLLSESGLSVSQNELEKEWSWSDFQAKRKKIIESFNVVNSKIKR